jgi:hypothetical protein
LDACLIWKEKRSSRVTHCSEGLAKPKNSLQKSASGIQS